MDRTTNMCSSMSHKREPRPITDGLVHVYVVMNYTMAWLPRMVVYTLFVGRRTMTHKHNSLCGVVKLLAKTTFPIQTTVRHGSWFLCRNCVSRVFVVVVWRHWVVVRFQKLTFPIVCLTVVVVVGSS